MSKNMNGSLVLFIGLELIPSPNVASSTNRKFSAAAYKHEVEAQDFWRPSDSMCHKVYRSALPGKPS